MSYIKVGIILFAYDLKKLNTLNCGERIQSVQYIKKKLLFSDFQNVFNMSN